MASEPLSDTEAAELREWLTTEAPARFIAPHVLRLLDEVQRGREMADDVALLTLDVRDPKRVAALERLKKRIRARL